MKNLAFAICAATLLLASPSFAQSPDAPPAPGADQGTSAGPGADAGGGGDSASKGGTAKEVISACRTQAKGQGLKGQAMKQAMMDCVQKQNPRAANVLKCRMEAKDKGMKPGSDDMKAYVKDCKKKAS